MPEMLVTWGDGEDDGVAFCSDVVPRIGESLYIRIDTLDGRTTVECRVTDVLHQVVSSLVCKTPTVRMIELRAEITGGARARP